MGTKSQTMEEERRPALSSLFSFGIGNYLGSHYLLLLTMTSKGVCEAVSLAIRERAEKEGEGAVFLGKPCGSEHLIQEGELLFESAFHKNEKWIIAFPQQTVRRSARDSISLAGRESQS